MRWTLSNFRPFAIAAVAALVCACGGSPTGPTPPASPQVYSITPARGSVAGGTSVRIGGANFSPGAIVTIGGAAATEVVVESSAAITARTPAHAAGSGDVVVTVSGKTAVLTGGFTFEAGAAPVISSISARGSRTNEPANFADLGEEIAVVATVQDADTPVEQLQFEWTADAGTFTGTGASVKWRAPASATTPGQATLTVAVSDGGTRVTSTAIVSLHDSVKEVGDTARQFLLDFSDSSIRDANYVLRNFSQSSRCIAERDSEKYDVEKNRRLYQTQSSSIGSATVNFSFGGKPCSYTPVSGDACAAVPAVWISLCLQTNSECVAGTIGRTSGIDFVTAVYEDSKWQLCASHFKTDGHLQPGFIR